MITYEKRKNSNNWYLPYLNLGVAILIMGVFFAMNVKVSDNLAVQQDELLTSASQTVDVSGEWVGTMTEDYSDAVRYDYRVVFDQYQEDLLGFSFQESTNYTVDIYAESAISGDIDGDEIYFFEESTLVLDNLSLDYWCRIEVRLNYQVIAGQETLIGTWDSAEEDRVGCDTITGRVILTRQ
ncbi:MAG: hypothetical protein WBC91_08785 [Phototrophicaceae bacterium]